MNEGEISFYDRLPINMLAGFYYHISKNLEDEILSNAIYHEIDLIKQTAVKKGILLTYLYYEGSLMILYYIGFGGTFLLRKCLFYWKTIR